MDYWMPLGIILYFLSRLIGGQGAEVGLNVIIWSFVAISVFFRIKSATESNFSASLGFFSMLFAGRSIFYLLTTDNIAFYAAIGFLLFWLLGQQKFQPFKVALVCASAMLMRIEGVIIVGFVFIYTLWKERNFKSICLMLFLILILTSPWIYRNFTELGKLWPSNYKALFLVEYNDIFCSEYSGDIDRFFKQGTIKIFRQRLSGFITGFVNLCFVPGMIFFCLLWPLGMIDLWQREGRSFFALMLLFLVFCGLIIPLQAERGTAMHISALFVPYFSVMNGLGINRLMKNANRLKKFVVLLAFFLFGWAIWVTGYSVKMMVKNQNSINQPYQQLIDVFPEIERFRVVSVSPIRVFHETGAKGVMISASSQINASQLADKYNCDVIILDNRAEFRDWNIPEGFEKMASTSHLLIMKRK